MAKFILDKESGTFIPAPSGEEHKDRTEAAIPESSVELIDKGGVNLASGEPGLPDEPVETFRRLTDLSVFQVTDSSTGKIMMMISGYALQIKFNRDAITSAADVEQCAEGIKKMFYGVIMEQLIGDGK